MDEMKLNQAPETSEDMEEDIVLVADDDSAADTEAEATIDDVEETIPDSQETKESTEGAAEAKAEASRPQAARRAAVSPDDANRLRTMRRAARQRERTEAERAQSTLFARFATLNDAMHHNSIIWGEIIGVRMPDDPDDLNAFARLNLDSQNGSSDVFVVDVPYNELFHHAPIDLGTVNLDEVSGRRRFLHRQRLLIEKMYGLHIPVIIRDIKFNTASDYSIIASRSAALKALRHTGFFGRTPQFVVGSDYDATVTSVSPNSLAFTLGGVDFVLDKRFITNKFIQDMRSFYKVGDLVRMRMVDIRTGENDDVRLRVDPIVVETESALPRMAHLKPGDLVRGVITRLNRSATTGAIQIYAWIPTWEVPAKVSSMNANDFGKPPIPGDEVRLTVAGVTSYNYLRVYCRGNNGNGGLFTRG